MKLHSKMTISDLLKRQPRATGVFIKRKMLCVGCPAEAFHTLEDAARLYDFDLNDLITAISKVDPKERQP
jgi:hybrid cluster-associated redox disulfide protein